MLEETGLVYEPHRIDILANENQDSAFLALNPNGKIPAIFDPDGPSGRPLALFESGAILIYLADKTGRFLSADPNARYETIQWLMWQMGGVGPMFGQVGFFNKFAGKGYEDKRPRDRYATESARLLGVLDERLATRQWVMDYGYSIADISLLGWVRNLIGFYEARELVGFDRFKNVQRWLDDGLSRPAVQRGLQVAAA
jgi:GST-like protein